MEDEFLPEHVWIKKLFEFHIIDLNSCIYFDHYTQNEDNGLILKVSSHCLSINEAIQFQLKNETMEKPHRCISNDVIIKKSIIIYPTIFLIQLKKSISIQLQVKQKKIYMMS